MDASNRPPGSMNLRDAIRFSRRSLDDNEIEESTDNGYRTRLWDFVRILRGHPELTDLDAREAFAGICRAAEEYCLKGEDPWTDYLKFSQEDEVEFLTTWSKVKYAAGVQYLEEAACKADSHPLVPENNRTRRNRDYEKFISVAAHLQMLVGSETNILLPCEKLAKFIGEGGVDPSWISRLRQLAVADGYLEETKPYQWSSCGDRKATEFRFRIDRFPELQESRPTQDQNGEIEKEEW